MMNVVWKLRLGILFSVFIIPSGLGIAFPPNLGAMPSFLVPIRGWWWPPASRTTASVLPLNRLQSGYEDAEMGFPYHLKIKPVYVLGEALHFEVIAYNPGGREPLRVEHPESRQFAFQLVRTDGYLAERPHYQTQIDGKVGSNQYDNGLIERVLLPAKWVALNPGESLIHPLIMGNILGFELIDPGHYQLSLGPAEDSLYWVHVSFHIQYQADTSRPYLERLMKSGTYHEKVWAKRILAEYGTAN